MSGRKSGRGNKDVRRAGEGLHVHATFTREGRAALSGDSIVPMRVAGKFYDVTMPSDHYFVAVLRDCAVVRDCAVGGKVSDTSLIDVPTMPVISVFKTYDEAVKFKNDLGKDPKSPSL